MRFLTKGRILSAIGLLLVLASLPVTIKLAQNPQILLSLASNDPITFYNPDGSAITESEVYAEQTLPVIHSLTVRVELIAPNQQTAYSGFDHLNNLMSFIPRVDLVKTVYGGSPCDTHTCPAGLEKSDGGTYCACVCPAGGSSNPACGGSAPATTPAPAVPVPTGAGCIVSRFSCQCDNGRWGSRPYNSCQGGEGYTGPCECAPAPAANRPAPDGTVGRQTYRSGYTNGPTECVRELVLGSCYYTSMRCGGNLCTQQGKLCTFNDSCMGGAVILSDPEYTETCICANGQQYQPRCGNGIPDMNEYAGNCPEDNPPRNSAEEALVAVVRGSGLTMEQRDPNQIGSRGEADRQAFIALHRQVEEVASCTLSRLAAGNLTPCTPSARQSTSSSRSLVRATSFILTDSPTSPSDPSEADPNALVGSLNNGIGATTYTFSNSQEGPKTLFVKFIYSNDTSLVRLKTVIYKPQNETASAPTPAPAASPTPATASTPAPSPGVIAELLPTGGFPTPSPSPSLTKAIPTFTAFLTCEGIRRPAVNGLLEARVVGADRPVISQVVTFAADGRIQNPPELDIGKEYIITVKPNLSLRKAIRLAVSVFNQDLGELNFEMGDVVPEPTDNIINSLDLLKLQEEAANPPQILTSDFNLDGVINSIDYTCLNSNFNKSGN